MQDSQTVPFAVVFSDGERENNVGTVAVGPSMSFKRLLSLLSKKLGMPPSSFSIFIAEVASGRQILITAKVNLATMPLCGGGGYYFLVRRTMRINKNPAPPNVVNHSLPMSNNLPENVMLLPPSAGAGGVYQAPLPAFWPVYHAPMVLNPFEYDMMMWNLWREREMEMEIERESYLRSMGFNHEPVRLDIVSNNNGGGGGGGRGGAMVCQECLRAKDKGINPDFHLCVHDEQIIGFRSTAGPISRPVRNSGS